MASIASQLQAIKSALGAAPEPARRPITRPSVLFDAKEAADIDLRAILPIALSGLEHLGDVDNRFRRYSNTLFSENSLEVNREQQTFKENEELNKSISSYLRLLAGHLQLPAALKTLEYLIRRYLVHVYNVDELLLCALPYHDTHAFVRIVQLINLGNSKWAFLDAVKSSGAPPPRSVMVQQCIRDKAVLEALCNYAAPTKEFHHATTVVCFCTAVVVECLGAIPTLDTDVVQRVLRFVFDSLNPVKKGDQDYKSQSVSDFPKKPLMILKDIRDFSGILSVLSSEFNIEKFIRLYVESLVGYSFSDDSCHSHLIEIVEALQIEKFVERIVCKVIHHSVKALQATENLDMNRTGLWAKKTLNAIGKKYPKELRDAIHKFLENSEVNTIGEDSASNLLGLVFDESKGTPTEISDSNIWFSLEHPKAEVRKSALTKMAAFNIFKNHKLDRQNLINMKDAIIHNMYDDDLDVVQATLSIEGLAAVASPDSLLKAYDDLLTKCINIIHKGGGPKASKACDVAVSCLEKIIVECQLHYIDHAKDIAVVVFRLLIVHPKTVRVNLKALELAKSIQWEFYTSSSLVYNAITTDKMKSMSSESVVSINMRNIKAFAETFLANPNKHVEWLVDAGKRSAFSRTTFLLIILQALLAPAEVLDVQMNLCQACLPVLKNEWCQIMPKDDCVGDEISIDKLEKCITELVKHAFNNDTEALNSRTLVCIFWAMLRVQSFYIKQNCMINDGGNTILDDMFLFFITSPGKNIFQKHLQYLMINCTREPFQFISKYFMDEGFSSGIQVESLLMLASICSACALPETTLDESLCLQLLLGFPCVMLPLAHENKDIRSSAIKYIEGLSLVWQRLSASLSRNGNNSKLPKCMLSPTFGVFLGSLVNQKTMISSDATFLPAYISSMLSPSQDLMVPENLHERFDQSTKDAILHFILRSGMKLSSYGKFMVLSILKGVGSILFDVEDVKSLFFDLLDRRNQYQNGPDSRQILSTHEIQIVCLLLEVLLSVSDCGNVSSETFEALLKVLRIDVSAQEDPVIVMPCVTALQAVQPVFFDFLKTDTKEKVFASITSMFRIENAEIRNAARDALLRINVHASTAVKFIELIAARGDIKVNSKRIKRKDDLNRDIFKNFDDLFGAKPTSSILLSLLDILFLKKDVIQRPCLLQPLFKLLSKLLSDQWISNIVCQYNNGHDASSITPDLSNFLIEAQQLVLLILKDIMDTLQSDHQDALFNSGDVNLLVNCIRSAKDRGTRNHGFSLIASLAKAFPQLVSESIEDLFIAIGDAVKQIFVKALADVAEHRRVTLMVYLLRTLGEKQYLGTVIMYLLRSLVDRISHSPEHQDRDYALSLRTMPQEWEYDLVVNITNQYSYKLWFHCLSKLLKEIRVHEKQNLLPILHLAMRVILLKLQDTELIFDLDSEDAANSIQGSLGELMEEVVLCTVAVRDKKTGISSDALKELRDSANTVLKVTASWMSASMYFKGISRMLDHPKSVVKRKALGILCETAKGNGLIQKKQKKARKLNHRSTAPQVDKSSAPYFSELCFKILELVDREVDSDSSVKIAAISSLETLAKEYPSDNPAYSKCLSKITNHISSGDVAASSRSIHTVGSLINVLGSKTLPQLPLIMKNLLQISHKVSFCSSGKCVDSSIETDAKRSNQAITILFSVLTTVEVIVKKLGEFVNPYLEGILDLVVLHPECASRIDEKLDAKAADVRRLLTERVPVRLMLSPLLNLYNGATKCGEASLSLAFEMLSTLIGTMDRQAIGTYHAKVYDHCLVALDLRRQHLDSLKDIATVEQSIIHAIITLTMKLTEATFRPLFLRTLEWAESDVDQSTSKRSMDRGIVFYKLVNSLADKHRSLFTPYFKYLLEGSVQYLSEDNSLISSKQKKKKAKLDDAQVEQKDKLSGQKLWNLRALVLKSLHKCFLYDNDQTILDSSNFQQWFYMSSKVTWMALLKPIVSQFVMEPPEHFESVPEAATVDEVDETLVLCLGQMAVTARSDVLWKPLNHEVLMRTRSDKVRPKMLGLKVVRYMVQHLKEEYVVLLPETIPFLAELLEDVELPVKTLAQEIVKEMETLSGESLRQYL
uniref:BP28 C-terminal domain-containing protein n=1 Tax=Leersia perrieri TaxID=77586 RepID=A0A0D9W7V0_9ORYZ